MTAYFKGKWMITYFSNFFYVCFINFLNLRQNSIFYIMDGLIQSKESVCTEHNEVKSLLEMYLKFSGLPNCCAASGCELALKTSLVWKGSQTSFSVFPPARKMVVTTPISTQEKMKLKPTPLWRTDEQARRYRQSIGAACCANKISNNLFRCLTKGQLGQLCSLGLLHDYDYML